MQHDAKNTVRPHPVTRDTLSPDVTILSIYYNRAQMVAESTESLIAQNYPKCEIILIDDGSSDSTRDALMAFSGHQRIKVISQANRGFTETLKSFSEQVTTEFIAIHASGDVSVPDRICEQAQYMKSNPDCGLVGGHVLMALPNGGNRLIPADRKRLVKASPLSLPSPLDHSTFFIRTEALKSIGGYRAVFEYAQDFDLLLRISRNWRVAALDKVLVHCNSYKVSDGVRMDPRKRIKQKYYVELALQSDESYRQCGVDMVAEWGRSCMFFRKRSRRIRRRLLLSFLRACRRSDWDAAILNLRAAKAESSFLLQIALSVALLVVQSIQNRAAMS